jgi:hypothetical protein
MSRESKGYVFQFALTPIFFEISFPSSTSKPVSDLPLKKLNGAKAPSVARRIVPPFLMELRLPVDAKLEIENKARNTSFNHRFIRFPPRDYREKEVPGAKENITDPKNEGELTRNEESTHVPRRPSR